MYIDEFKGVTRCIIPPYYDSANTIGAAITKVAREIDLIKILDRRNKREVVKAASKAAV